MIEVKNSEIIIENERQKRENNLTIHGVKKQSGSEKGNKKQDDIYITALFTILGVNTNPKSITRLGKYDGNDKSRPLKLIRGSIEEKSMTSTKTSV